MGKVKSIIILMTIILAVSNAKARPTTAKRMKSGNSNGYSMSGWYGGNNKHKCGLTKTKSKNRMLRY